MLINVRCPCKINTKWNKLKKNFKNAGLLFQCFFFQIISYNKGWLETISPDLHMWKLCFNIIIVLNNLEYCIYSI